MQNKQWLKSYESRHSKPSQISQQCSITVLYRKVQKLESFEGFVAFPHLSGDGEKKYGINRSSSIQIVNSYSSAACLISSVSYSSNFTKKTFFIFIYPLAFPLKTWISQTLIWSWNHKTMDTFNCWLVRMETAAKIEHI